MQIILAGESALAFWVWAARPNSSLRALQRRCGCNVNGAPKPSMPQHRGASIAQKLLSDGPRTLPSPCEFAISQSQIEALRSELGIIGPLSTLVASEKRVHPRANLKTLNMADARKYQEFYGLGNGIFVCSPELAFLQLSRNLPLEYLIMLGYELCGEYSVDDQSGKGFFDRPPLMNIAKARELTRTLERAGRKRIASQALSNILESTASPAESQLAALLITSTRIGGFGFNHPKANAIVLSDARSQKVSKRNWRACDLFWEEELVDVEYDSEAFHATRMQRFEDSVRRNALVSSNIKVIGVTPDQLRSPHEMETIATALARALGRRLRLRATDFHTRFCQFHKTVVFDYPKWRKSLFDLGSDPYCSEGEIDAMLDEQFSGVTAEPFFETA